MASLNIQPNVERPDEIYERLVRMHEGKTESESLRLNARLIMLLINQVGDDDIVLQAIDEAAAPGTGLGQSRIGCQGQSRIG